MKHGYHVDEYIELVLVEMQIQEPPQGAVQSILDEPIPLAVKKHLIKPLLSKKYRPSAPPRKRKERKRKAILEEFDPNPPQKNQISQEIPEGTSWSVQSRWPLIQTHRTIACRKADTGASPGCCTEHFG